MNLQTTHLVFLKKEKKRKTKDARRYIEFADTCLFPPPFGCFKGLEVTYYSCTSNLRFARSIWILVFVLRLRL